MTYIKSNLTDYSEIGDQKLKYFTEKSICYALLEKGLKMDEDFIFHVEIDGVPFNKNSKHEVDLKLKSHKGDELFVEIKGMMTYLEVNKLKYLMTVTNKNFYVLQLTELDWIEPYRGQSAKDAFEKSKKDFEMQIHELVSFVNGTLSGRTLTNRSKKRLAGFISCRKKDLTVWKNNL